MKECPSLQIACAVRALRAGGVIAYATEGVWGLGCDPFDGVAVQRVLDLKGRKAAKGLIMVADSLNQLFPLLAPVSIDLLENMRCHWPHPVTWVVPVSSELPRWITGNHSTAAVRISTHPQARQLCQAFGGPIVSTSANPQGRPPARNAFGVRKYFRHRIDYILPGAVGGWRKPSEIRDAVTGRVLRA